MLLNIFQRDFKFRGVFIILNHQMLTIPQE
jgi:hypothetical protein